MKCKLITNVFFGFFLASSIANAASFKDLDFDKAIDNGDIFFAPFKEDTRGRGYVWFRNYFYKWSPSLSTSPIKTITVSFYPLSYENGDFTSFATKHSLKPRGGYLLPEDAVLCNETPALKKLLEDFPYKETTKLGVAFPQLCGLRIKYSATDKQQEQALLDLITSEELMGVKVKLFSPSPSRSIVVDVPTIMNNLDAAGILSPYYDADNPSILLGEQVDTQALGFFSSRQHNTLYGLTDTDGDDVVYEIWKRYLSLFNPVPDTGCHLFIEQEDAERFLETTLSDTPGDPVLVIDH